MLQVMGMGLASEIIWKHKHDPASINRFIYYPDHLVQLPGGDQDIYQVLTSLMTEPLYNGLFKGAIHELVAPARSPQVVDETVSTFFRRRFGNSDIAENLVSAVMHGIYAGDIDRLSMRSIMSHTWNMEGTARSVLLGSVTSPSTTSRQTVVDLSSTSPEPDLQATLQASARSYSLKGGLQSLPDRIKAWLQDGPNINFRMRESVTDIKYDEKSDGILVSNCVSRL
jgi:oxygen-dependent protoporphyrinogen oxidase